MQSRAGDQWNEYQAKKIRMDNLSVTLDLLAMEPTVNPRRRSEAEGVCSPRRQVEGRPCRGAEKAREFEAEVTKAEGKAARYDLGEALLQIAVVLCSVTLFTRKRFLSSWTFPGSRWDCGGSFRTPCPLIPSPITTHLRGTPPPGVPATRFFTTIYVFHRLQNRHSRWFIGKIVIPNDLRDGERKPRRLTAAFLCSVSSIAGLTITVRHAYPLICNGLGSHGA